MLQRANLASLTTSTILNLPAAALLSAIPLLARPVKTITQLAAYAIITIFYLMAAAYPALLAASTAQTICARAALMVLTFPITIAMPASASVAPAPKAIPAISALMATQ